MLTLLSFALAADPAPPAAASVPDSWQEVTPVEAWQQGLLTADAAWALHEGACLPVAHLEGDPARVSLQVCTAEVEGTEVSCTLEGTLGPTWSPLQSSCSWEEAGVARGRGGVAGGFPGVGLVVAPFRLVELSAEAATWRRAWPAKAQVGTTERHERPCLPGTAGEDHARNRAGEAVRACHVGSGVQVVRAGRASRGMAVQVVPGEPVDCSLPCPDNPIVPQMQATQAALAGRWFTDPDLDAKHWFATEAACREVAQGVATSVPNPCATALED